MCLVNPMTRREWLAAAAAAPLLGSGDAAFWHEQARRIVDSAALPAGGMSGKWRNATPYDVHVPGGNMGYPAFWVRDAVMMLGAGFISARELEGWIRLMISSVRLKDWHVRPGVVVPAYAIPDHINFDGKPTFYPGNYETGDKQGGKPFGKYPPLDDHFYFLTAVWHHWKLSGDLALFRANTEFCERVYRVAPTDPETHLAVAGDIETENAKDFGFCDAVSKSGKLLFTSVLKFVAARQMADMFAASGEPEKARAYRANAGRIRRAIPPTFLRDGWLHSATGAGNQRDVWGSAFALWAGAVDDKTALEVSRTLARAYREGATVREGCVRHLPGSEGWQVAIPKVGEYQNGGFWGTPAGWHIAAVHRSDPAAARDLTREFVGFFRNHLRPDGLSEAWEWFNPETGRKVNPLYVATVALPYASLKQVGLLP